MVVVARAVPTNQARTVSPPGAGTTIGAVVERRNRNTSATVIAKNTAQRTTTDTQKNCHHSPLICSACGPAGSSADCGPPHHASTNAFSVASSGTKCVVQ